MSTLKDLARKALRGALEVRKRVGISRVNPLCVYDVAERLGLEVKFVALNSFGGMYVKTSETILVPSLRPPGRQAYTCAHEMGHWFFDHGTKADELHQVYEKALYDPEESLAHIFAGFLLAPQWAIADAFKRRIWDPSSCSPIQVYTISNQLGMGYQSLVDHLYKSLSLISSSQANELSAANPKQIRAEILGEDHSGHLIIADEQWHAVSIDLRVGDIVLLPQGTALEGNCAIPLRALKKGGLIVEAIRPGIMRVESSDKSWDAYVRVCRKEFQGRSMFRYMEDPDVY